MMMTEQAACGGVLVPDGGGHRRACFVEERGLWDELADVVYKNGTRPLQISVDHFIPRSMGGADGSTHLVHLYCQNVQGGAIAGPSATKRGDGIHAPGMQSKGGKIGGLKGGQSGTPEGHAKGGRIGGRTVCHIRWHLNRSVLNEDCDLCMEVPA